MQKPIAGITGGFARTQLDIPMIGATKFLAGVYVLEVISSEGDIMLPHFFSKGQKVTKVCLDMMKTEVKPWMVQVAAGKV